jgi:outer membrane lipopolysaccharide assembly protein LptE/RlpB
MPERSPSSGPLGRRPSGPSAPGVRPTGHGRRGTSLLLAAVTAVLLLATGCNYTFRAGAGLPSHVRTIAVLPLENESDRFDLAQQIHEAIQQEVPRAFGVRIASEENADAIIRGTVRRYAVDAGSYRSAPGGGAEVLERSVTVSLEIQVIDQRERMILWENRSLSARGQFQEGQELEEDGRNLAIEQIVRDIINGLQSNW